ncbi:hypothetical protein AGMMS49525_06920 [Bacteroidia bacterium]|nr:hypothetical protein AGMMS49525_06920 [Bacteroidia bacterium]
MKVYHGSYLKINEIDLAKSRANCDFGQGFYVTNIRTQADYWAERMGDKKNAKGVVTVFEFNERAWEDSEYKILRFDSYTESWLDFVVLNRDTSTTKLRHGYDIVEGPVADDAISVRISDYLDGKISKEDFLEELKFKKPTHQIAFCTLKSLQMIDQTTTESDSVFYHIDDYVVKQLITDCGMTEPVATDLYYASKIYTRLIDESTGLCLKSNADIYKLLLQELNLKQ